jgi:hydrogenase-1 operon protein HyaE
MTSPLIDALTEQHGVPLVDETALEALAQQHRHCLLFFTEDPVQFPESNDVAVVLPLLMQAFGERIKTAVVARASEHRLHSRFPFDGWPALVLLQEGEYVGAITRMQDWDVYLSEIERLLNTAPSRLPSFKIPVVGESNHHCH